MVKDFASVSVLVVAKVVVMEVEKVEEKVDVVLVDQHKSHHHLYHHSVLDNLQYSVQIYYLQFPLISVLYASTLHPVEAAVEPAAHSSKHHAFAASIVDHVSELLP